MKKAKIIKKKALILIVVVDLILLIGVFFTIQYVRDLMYADVQVNLREIATQNKDAITSRLSVELNNLKQVAKQISDKIGTAGDTDTASIQEAFASYAITAEDPDLYWADPNGHAVYTGGQVINITGRTYFARALAGYQNVSERAVSRMNGKDIFVISVPLSHNDQIIGTIQKQYDPLEMYKICMVPLFSEQGFMYIIDSNGVILVSPQQEQYNRESDNYFDIINRYAPETAQHLKTDIHNNQSGIMETVYDGEAFFSVYTPIEEVYDWYLISGIATGALSPNLNSIINLFYAVLFGTVLFFAFIMLYYLYTKNRQRAELERIAFVDPVTGGSSFAKFSLDLRNLLNEQPDGTFSLFSFDIDNFKYINSFYGFEVGDKILSRIHQLYSAQMQPQELLTRTGGDHFVMLLTNASQERIKALFQTEISLYGILLYFSAGLYNITDPAESVNLMVDKVGVAARKIKGMRYKRVEVYSAEYDKAVAKAEQLKRSMAKALAEQEIIPFFQPKVDVNTGELVGAEALARWRTKDGSLISPADFIPVCEQTGQIMQVDMAIFEQTLQFISRNIAAGVRCTPISVNFSRMHLLNGDFLENLVKKLRQYNVPPALIELELTETIIFDNHAWINKFITALHEIGVQISMDDFGSGYSSLHMLKEVHLDVLKIDRGFLMDTVDSQRQRVIFGAIVQMAHSLQMKVVVEGVETPDNVSLMKEFECRIAQGYFYSRPIALEEFEPHYRAGRILPKPKHV